MVEDRVVAEALSETVRRWDWEAAGWAEMRAILDGPCHAPAEGEKRLRRKHGLAELSHLTADELAGLPSEKVDEAWRLNLV